MKENEVITKHELISELVLLKNNLNNEYSDRYLNAEYVFINLRSFVALLRRFLAENSRSDVLIIVKNKEQKAQVEELINLHGYKNLGIKIIMHVRRLKQNSIPKLAIILDKKLLPSIKSTVTQFMANQSYIFFCLFDGYFLDLKHDPSLCGQYTLQGSFSGILNLAYLIKLVIKARLDVEIKQATLGNEEYIKPETNSRNSFSSFTWKQVQESKKKLGSKPTSKNPKNLRK